MTTLWYEITATTPAALAEAVAAAMRDIVPGGVTVEEPYEILGIDQGVRLREGEPYQIRAYLPASELGAVLTDDLRTSLQAFAGVELTARPFYEQDWSESWRQFFGVVETGGRIVVVPSWVEHEPGPDQIAIRLDPGQAFGTGHHETTRLCLRALEDAIRPGSSVLDVGTGSGILAIAAALLGASEVSGIDIDPVAVDVARQNAAENGLDGRLQLRAGTLKADHAVAYDVVVANINRDANVSLARAFGDVVKPGGMLIVSGFLAEDVGAVTGAMNAAGLRCAETRHERDWCAMGFRRFV